MTPTQLKEAAQVMALAAEGKQVQYRTSDNYEWEDVHGDPGWNWHIRTYRIKPEPRTFWMRQHREGIAPCTSCGFFKSYAEAACNSADHQATAKIVKVQVIE